MAKNSLGLSCPQSYLEADQDLLDVVCNGCGSAQAKFDFVPDTIYGLSISPACHIHDWMYYEGKTIDDKEEADRVFLNNMLRIINNQSANKLICFLRRRRAVVYYEMVCNLGGPAFWHGKE